MLPSRTFRKATELGIALTAIATLILAGCGGGGSSSAGNAVSNITTTLTPYKGMFTSGNVVLKDVNGNTITLVTGGTINTNGKAAVTFPANVAFPITVEVSGTYIDETTGASAVIAAGSPLRGMIPSTTDANAASGVPVTAITDLARATLPTTGFTAASAVAAITDAASNVLGVSSYAQAMLPPVFNTLGQTSDANTLKLTALAHVISQQGTGATLHAKLLNINASLVAGSAVNAVIPQSAFNNALAAINTVGGASGVVPAGSTPPNIPAFTFPSGSLGNVNSAGGGGVVVAPTPTITGFNPTTGAVGTSVTISGTNLVAGFPPAPTVKFGTTNAGVPYTNVSNTGITFTVPAGLVAGTHTMTVGGMAGTPVTVGTFTVTATAVAAVPAAPTNVVATAFSATQIDLSWTAVAGATGYNIYQSKSPGVVVSAANKVGTKTITYFSSTPLYGATPYYFVVTARNATGESIGSTEVSATTSPIPVGVTAPTGAGSPDQIANLQIVASVMNPPLAGQIGIYVGVFTGTNGINVYRSTSPNVMINPTNLVNLSPIGITSLYGSSWSRYTDIGLEAGTKYYYKTTEVNAAGEGPGSTELIARTPLATVGSGIGLTLSPAFKGVTVIPNRIPYELNQGGVYTSAFEDAVSREFRFSYIVDPANGDRLALGLTDTVGGSDSASLDVAVVGPSCAVTTAVGYPTCASLGIALDRIAGSISFSSTPMKSVFGSTLGSVFNLSGTLNFTPF